MANVYTVRPIKIDTVMASGYSAQTGAHVPIRVIKVYWEGPTTADHQFTITDASTGANVLLDGKCDTAKVGQVFDFEEPRTWKDFRVTVLGSGTLWIFTQ